MAETYIDLSPNYDQVFRFALHAIDLALADPDTDTHEVRNVAAAVLAVVGPKNELDLDMVVKLRDEFSDSKHVGTFTQQVGLAMLTCHVNEKPHGFDREKFHRLVSRLSTL